MISKTDQIENSLKSLPEADAQVIRDALAERASIERRLKESEARMRTWLECSPACTKILDLDFNLQYMSHAGIAGLGIDDVTKLYGKPYPFDFFPEAAKARMVANLRKAKETKQIISEDGPVYDLKRNELWFQATIVPICDESGDVEYLIVVSVETTQRKKAEQQLAEQKERLAVTLKSIGDGVITTDTDGNVGLMNTVAEDLTGWPLQEAAGKPLEEVFNIVNSKTAKPEISPAARVLETGLVVGLSNHTVLISKDGKRYQISDSGAPIRDRKNCIIGVVLVFRDVTAEYRMKEQFHQAQKMEAIGQLAGGIAHDFNNMLGGIIGATELLESMIPVTPDVQELYKIVLESSNRAADLTSKLLSFARKQPRASDVIDLHDTVEDAIALLKTSVDRRISFVTELKAENSNLVGAPSQLQNTIMNLAINASHAMPDGGTITISSRTVELDSFFCKTSPFDIKPGPFIELEIRDTGQGMPPEDLPRIFEPFFTTKGQGKGTGLGLAAVFGTIQQHGGSIAAYSELGKGSSFCICLPLSEEDKTVATYKPESVQGQGKILLVDDEPLMLAAAKATLQHLGYSVVTAENGALAVEAAKAAPEDIDLVLLDMIMPVMSGRECFEKLLEIRSDFRVILSSGYTHEEDVGEMKEKGLSGFIHKPYRKDELSRLIDQVLKA